MSNVTNKRSPPLTQLNSTGIEPESACSKEGSVNVSTVTQDIGSIPIPAESGNSIFIPIFSLQNFIEPPSEPVRLHL
eukprot:Pgem_evm1s18610